MNLFVTGSRDYPNLDAVYGIMHGLINHPHREADITELYVGDARGVDRSAAQAWKKITGKDVTCWRADWSRYGKSAGPRRNIEMVDAFIENGGGIFLAFWDWRSPGTKHCMDYGVGRGALVLIPDHFRDVNIATSTGTLALRVWRGSMEEEKSHGSD